MSPDTIATILTGIGVLFGVWRLQADIARSIEGVRRDLANQIAAGRSDLSDVRSDLSNQIATLSSRIDNVILDDRRRAQIVSSR